MQDSQEYTASRMLLATHIDELRRRLRAQLPCNEDAQDIAQQACLNLLQVNRPETIENPKAYLFQIARNLLYHHYQRPSQRLSTTSDIDVDTLACGDNGLLALTTDAIRREQINRAVQELSPKCQQALRLRWREGLRVAEIAERMDLSIAMVKKYLAQGLAHCRERLNPYVLADQAT